MDKRLHRVPGRIRILPGVLAFVSMVTGAVEPKPLDLPDAIRIALERNADIRQTRSDDSAGRIGIRQAEENFRVQVSPEVAAGTSSEGSENRLGLNIDKQYPGGVNVHGDLGYEDELGWQLEINRYLFSDQARRQASEPLEQARSRSRILGLRLDDQRQSLIVDVVETYRTVLQLDARQEYNAAAISRLEKLVDASRARERLGRTTRVDTLRTEMQLGDAINQSGLDREALVHNQRRLSRLLGNAVFTPYRLSELPQLGFSPPTQAAAIRTALENRSDYLGGLEEQRNADRGLKLAQSLLKPEVTLFGQWQRNPRGLDSDDEENRWFIGLRTDGPFNHRRKGYAFAQANLARIRSQERVRQLRTVIENEVRDALAVYRQRREAVEIAGQNLAFAESRLSAAGRLFQLGRESQLAVALAESDFLASQIQVLSTRSDLAMSVFLIHRAQGTVDEYVASVNDAATESLAMQDSRRW